MPDKIKPSEFAAKIKAKYPTYKDVDDSTLVSKIVEKYPYYKETIDFGTEVKPKEVAPEIPKIDQATIERAKSIKSFKDFAMERGSPLKEIRSAAEGTYGPDLAMKAQMDIDVQQAPERKKIKEEKIRINKEKATNKAVYDDLIAKGITPVEGDLYWKASKNKIEAAANNGDLALTVNRAGEPVYKRSLGYVESFTNAIKESIKTEDESNYFLSADIDKKIQFADEYLTKEPEGVNKWFPEMMGGALKPIGEAVIGGMAGTAIAPGAGTAAGIIGSIMAMTPSSYNKGYMNTSIQMYSKELEEIKKKKGVVTQKDKEEAMGRATTQGVYGGLGDVAFAAGLVAIPMGSSAAGVGLKNSVVNLIKHTSHDVAKQAVLGAGIASVKDVAASASGYNISAAENIKNILESGKAGAETALAFGLYHAGSTAVKGAVSPIPKYVQSYAKEYLSTIPKTELNNMSSTLEAKGVIPEGATEKMNADLQKYEQAKKKVPDSIPEEDMGSFAGLVEAKESLENQKKMSDPIFHEQFDKKISAIDERMKKMQVSKEPIKEEADDLLGNLGEAEPVTEETIDKSVSMLEPEGEVAMVSKEVAPEGMVEVNAEEKPAEVKKEASGGMVKFAEGVEMPFKYKVIEANEVKPSHLPSGERNPEHSIALAQPKERGDIQSKLAQEKIAKSPNLGEVGESPNPYFGAPVVNARGEVIQGNNRSLGLKRHYDEGGTSYKEQLANNAEKFGLTREQVEGMNNPILVRETPIDDAMAIELGNYDVKDLETGGKQRIDPITTVRKMSAEDKNKLAAIIFDGDYATVKEAIRENQKQVGSIVSEQINAAQRNTIFDKEGNINPKGIEDIENIVNNMLFESGPAVLPEAFTELSYNQQKNIQKAIKHIFNTPEESSILPEVQNAVLGLYDFRKSGIENFDTWLITMDIFEGKTPKDVFTPVEIEIMKTLNKAKNQSELSKKLGSYAELVRGRQANLLEGEMAGISKKEAIKKTFNVEYEDVTKRYAEPKGEVAVEEVVREQKPEQPAEQPARDVRAEEVYFIEGDAETIKRAREYYGRKYESREQFERDYEANRFADGETRAEYIQRVSC